MDTSEYLGLFLDESRENLQALNAALLELERDPADSESLASIFRVAHSLKGMSATMGFDGMAKLTHRMEEVLTVIRDGGAPVSGGIVEALFTCLDTLEGMVGDIEGGGTGQTDTSELLQRLDVIEAAATGEPALAEVAATMAPEHPAETDEATGDEAEDAGEHEVEDHELGDFEVMVLREALERGQRVVSISVAIAENSALPAARAYMVFQALEAHGDIARSDPPAEDIEGEEFSGRFSVWLVTGAEDDAVHAAVTGVSEVDSCKVSAIEVEALVSEAAPSDEPPAAADAAPAASSPATPSEAGPPRPRADAPAAKKAKAASTVRVGTDKLDSLMNLMGEMVIHRTRLSQLAGDHGLGDLRGAVEEMTRVTNDLQTLIMQVRMMPVEAVFMRFPRMVRDLAQTLGKRLELHISGEDTELDRTVIDELGDPLVHLLRNAVDHGLETPEERIAAGKDPVGNVWLRARHAGNSVVIEVEEDGGGIDPDVIRSVAVSKGVCTREEADALSDKEAVDLIFAPGFSTAKETTDVSGRGVGMDAVRSKIAGLNGDVEISTVLGKGTLFSIRLPLTLAIIQALLVRASNEIYALPLEAIEETVVLRRDETHPVNGRPCMVLRGRVVPLISLRERLSIDETLDGDESLEIVVVRSGGDRVGVVVDDLLGQQDIVIKHLPAYLGDVMGIAGATILGDGSVALIVDVGALTTEVAA